MKYNKLNQNEKNIIENKGTEKPFTGKYWKFSQKGYYICRKCNSKLYESSDKFDSHCGWPSFDDEVPGAIAKKPDADGVRTEIICSSCGAHLGHVFTGEHLTDKNIRHCVNSISLMFIPEVKQEKLRKIYLAGGCFWGVEFQMKKLDGIENISVGYIGGKKDNPDYEFVCSKDSGYAEAVEIVYDPEKIELKKIIKRFFEIHDFTQINRQGPDIGYQYRSEIFFTTQTQKKIINEVINLLKDKDYNPVTKVTPASKFWKAENYHQNYYSKKGGTPYCHGYRKIFD